MIPKTIAHYEILAPIGEGGMGVVYRALDTRLGRPVAVKLLSPEGAIDGERRKRFVQEARAASALNHPHIITIYDIGQAEGLDFIAMEYVPGPSLAQAIAESRLPVGEALQYGVEIADALATAHAAGILHRDLKPANIMLGTAGDRRSIKVLDFGLAKLTESADFRPIDERASTASAGAADRLQTEDGTILGTAAYMSPEQAEGKPADARSDVFSFGAVLYEMLTGRRAFSGATKISTLAAILTKEPEPPSRLIPGLPRDLEKLLLRCLRKSPERRWQSMADLKVALQDLREESDAPPCGRTVRRRCPPAGGQSPWRSVSRSRSPRSGSVAGGERPAYGLKECPRRFSPGSRRTSAGPIIQPSHSTERCWRTPPIAAATTTSTSGSSNCQTGASVRLTHHTADEVEPAFSADGSRIAFQSSRLGGGIYLVPTLGGEERLLAARGFSPRFSPDGKWIAYGVSEPAGSRIYVAPAAGGPASPDHQRLLSGPVPRLVTRRPSPVVLGAASPRRPAGEQRRLVRGRSSRRTTGTDRRARRAAQRRIPGVSRTTVAGCLGHRRKPHPLPRHRRGLLEHVAGGDRFRPLAYQRQAAAGDVRHDRRSGGLGHRGRTDGFQQPDDGR